MRMFKLSGLFLLCGFILAGCSKDEIITPGIDPNDQLYGSAQNDQQFFELFAQHDDFFRNDDVAMNDGPNPAPFDDEIIGTMTEIHPIRWSRFIRNIQRSVQLDSISADSLAYVTVTRTFTGVLVILARYDSTTVDTVRKDFSSQTKKRIIFRRVASDPVIWRNWRPVAISLIEGGTTSSDAINLAQLKLVFNNEGVRDSIVVHDPLSTFFRVRRNRDINGTDVPDFAGGQEARLFATVVSASPDTDLVVLRYGFAPDGRRRRIRLHLISESFDGTNYTRVYTRIFNMHFHRGVFAAAVDAMTRETLFDDTAPVSTSFWGVPYVVTR